jgi:hypothetical protein
MKRETKSEWPASLKHEGKTYLRTGKTGTSVSTGQPSAEYEAASGLPHRVWLRADGTVRDE